MEVIGDDGLECREDSAEEGQGKAERCEAEVTEACEDCADHDGKEREELGERGRLVENESA